MNSNQIDLLSYKQDKTCHTTASTIFAAAVTNNLPFSLKIVLIHRCNILYSFQIQLRCYCTLLYAIV